MQTGVGSQEGSHFFGITCQNDDEIIPIVFHSLDQCINGLQTKAVILAAIERIGFVNKQHAANGTLDDLHGQRSRMTNVFANQVAPADLHQLSARKHADRLQILGNQSCDRRFAGTGISGKNHMHGDIADRKSLRFAHFLHLIVLFQRKDVILDLFEAYNLVHFCLDGIHFAAITAGQQRQQIGFHAIQHGKQMPVLTNQRNRLVRCIFFQFVLCQGLKTVLKIFQKVSNTVFRFGFICDKTVNSCICSKCKAKLLCSFILQFFIMNSRNLLQMLPG